MTQSQYLVRFLQNIRPGYSVMQTNFLAGGVKFWYIFNFVLSLCNQISTSTFDLRVALLVPPQSENASYAPAEYYICYNQK